MHPGWPKSYMSQQQYVVHVLKLRIMHSLHVASASHGHGVGSVNVYEKPSRRVRAIGFHNKGALVLVPNTLTTKAKTQKDEVIDGEVCVKLPQVGLGGLDHVEGMRFVLTPLLTKDLPCAAWAVRPTNEVAKANMCWSTMKVSTVAVAEGPAERMKSTRTLGPETATASASPKSASCAAASASLEGSAQQCASEFVVEVPVLVNTKAVSDEQELLLHRPKQEKVAKAKKVNLAKMITAKEKGAGGAKQK